MFGVWSKGISKIGRGGVGARRHENYTMLDDPVTLPFSLDKPYVHAILRSHGLQTPSHGEFSLDNFNQAYVPILKAYLEHARGRR